MAFLNTAAQGWGTVDNIVATVDSYLAYNNLIDIHKRLHF